MSRIWWSLLLLVTVALGAGQVSAGQGGFMMPPFTIEQIKDRLGADNAMTEDQQKKVEAANAEFTKKMDEAKKKEGVAAAQKELDTAREARDRDAMMAARKKVNDAMGFNPTEEYRKVLAGILSEAQVTKLFARGGARKKAE